MSEPLTGVRRLADNPVAVVGMAGMFPGAPNYRDYWQNVVDALDCTQDVPPTHWLAQDWFDPDPATPDRLYTLRGGFLPDIPFDPMEFGLPPNLLEVTTVVQLLSLVVARDLLRDARAPGSPWYDPSRTGVVLGITGPTPLTHPMAARLETPVLKEVVRSCGLSAADADAIAEKFLAAYPPWVENTFPGMLGNVVAGRIANRLDLGGMNCAVDAACASSLSALRMAVSELVEGRADLMITGGCDTENTVFGYMCFARTQALSRSGRIQPFDADADGTLVGEGIGMLALKRLADAERDGDRVYAVIRGIGSSSDGRFKSIYAPRPEGQQLAIRRAYDDARLDPSAVELFEAHATGTAAGDKAELTSLTAVLGEGQARYAAIGSVKSQIGHTKGAAGTASLIKLALSLHHKVLPPTINVSTPNPALTETGALYVNTRTRPWILDPERPHRRAAASAMGFGGTNFHVVLEEVRSSREGLRVMHRTPRAHLWHAPTPQALVAVLRSGDPGDATLIPTDHARVGFVASTDAEYQELHALALSLLTGLDIQDSLTHPRGVFVRRHALADARVGALFAGQGSQYVDMGLTAALNTPPVAQSFDEANAAFAGAAPRLAQVVFPPPSFDPDAGVEQEATLRRTEYAQPAIGALSAGQFRWLTELGLPCADFLGHSFGELTALWAAGALTTDAFFALARARGQAMAPRDPGADTGAMAAVNAPRQEVAAVLEQYPDVLVCNHNAPDQVVVGGGTDAVTGVVEALTAQGVRVRRLPVAAAFHTPYVEHGVETFAAAVAATTMRAPSGRVYANTERAHYGNDLDANRRVLVEQLRRPVEFVAGLEAMHAAGCNVFVEFGPGRVLTGLAAATLGDRGAITIATDAGPGGDSDLALRRAAVHLAVLGLPIEDIGRHDAPGFDTAPSTGMTVMLNGTTYRPAERTAHYRDLLENGYRVTLPTTGPAPAPAPSGSAPVPDTDSGPREPDRPAPVDAVSTAPAPSPGVPVPTARPEPPSHDLPVPGPGPDRSTDRQIATPAAGNGFGAEPAQRPVAAPATLATEAPDHLDELHDLDPLAQHLTLHGRYLEGQLRVADALVEALHTRDGEDGLVPALEAITRQSLSISRTHVRANEILGALSELGSGVAVGASGVGTRRLPTDHLAPADHRAPGTTALPASAPQPAWAPASPAAPPHPEPTPEPAPGGPIARQATGTHPAPASPAPTSPATQPAEAHLVPADGTGTHLTPTGSVPTGPGTPAPAGNDPDITTAVTEVVAEKTGYPADMLAPDMDLEADLGIDSIKRVQILGVLQTRFDGLPQVGPEQLAELHTLADIADFVRGASTPDTDASAQPTPAGNDPDITTAVTEVVAEKTGYPADMLAPDMDLEADLGIDSIKRVQILGVLQTRFDGLPQVGPEQLAELHTLADIADFVRGGPRTQPGEPVPADAGPATDASTGPPATEAAGVDAAQAAPGRGESGPDLVAGNQLHLLHLEPLPAPDRLENPYGEGAHALVVDGDQSLVAALEQDGWTVHRGSLLAQPEIPARLDLCLLVLPEENNWPGNVSRLEAAVLLAGRVQGPLVAAGATRPDGRSAFVTLTRLDGGLGHHGGAPLGAALTGGVSGLVKTMALEAPGVFCRAVDVHPDVPEADLPALLAAELTDAAVRVREVGIDISGRRVAPRMTVRTVDDDGDLTVGADDVFLVTGGARGVTADCVLALAAQVPAEFVLLGRTDLDGQEGEPAWALGVGAQELKQAAVAHLTRDGARVTPVEVDRLTRALVARRQIHATLEALCATGARASYRTVDVTDGPAVRNALADLAPRVTGLVHGAGALADAYLPAKTADAVHAVISPKLEGLGHLLDALGDAPLRHVVLFGSVAGVLGNPGQGDYACANEAFGPVAAALRHRGVAHAVALNWGPWDGGMVTPQLRDLFLDRGVQLIDPTEGAHHFVRQLRAAHAEESCVLVGQTRPLAPPAPQVVAGFTAHRPLGPTATDPVLTDHEVGSHAVLPAVAGLGWLARGVEDACPGAQVVEVRDFQVLNGIVLDDGVGTDHWLRVEPGVREENRVLVRAGVHSAGAGPLPRPHFAATLVLAAHPPAAPANLDLPQFPDGTDGAALYAGAELFHGPRLQGIRRVLVRADDRLVMACRLADIPFADGAFGTHLHRPLQADVVLQAAGLLGLWTLGEACLPLGIGRATFHAPLPDDEPFLVVVDGLRIGGGSDVTVNATACLPDGRILQTLTDITEVATPGMSARFREAADRRDARYPTSDPA